MDVNGAQELRRRIEEQQHWAAAASVREGRQPAADPDASRLEEVADGVRLYGREVSQERVEGRSAVVTRRLTKRLVDGLWETDYVLERVEYGSPPATARLRTT